MFILSAICVLIGIVVGIKLTFLLELAIFIISLVLMHLWTKDKEIEGMLAVYFWSMFAIGMVVGNIYVMFAFPIAREAFFTNVAAAFSWLFTP